MRASIAFHGAIKEFGRVTAVLESEGTQDGGVKVLTAQMIAAAMSSGCQCEDLGLRPGITHYQLQRLGAGCCDSRVSPGKGWVCATLDKIRRTWNA